MPHANNNSFVQNPPYMLSTTPHLASHPAGHSASTSLALYKRSFQGPFPDVSAVNFNIQSPTDNKLLVTPIPFNGGAKKKKPVSVKKKKKPVSVKKKKKPVSVKKKKKPVSVKKKNTIIKKKKKTVSVKKKKTIIKKKKTKGGITRTTSK